MARKSLIIMLMLTPMLVMGQGDDKSRDIVTIKDTPKSKIILIGPEMFPVLSFEENNAEKRVHILGATIVSDNYTDTITRFNLGKKKFELIDSNEGSTKIRMVYSPTEKFTGHWRGFSLGLNYFGCNYFTRELPKGYEYLDLIDEKAIEVSFNIFQKNITLSQNNKNIGIVTGLGITLNNYKFSSQEQLTRDKITGNTTSKEISPRFAEINKLLIQYITAPLLFEYQIPDKNDKYPFYVNAGVYGSFKFSSHVKIKYDDNDKPSKRKFREDLNINPFKYGAMVRVGYRYVNLYATCDMSRLFKKKRGPELYPWSVGIMLLSF